MTNELFNHALAPMRIGRVRLRVRDLDAVAGFYQRVMGLEPVASADGRITLGHDGQGLLELVGDPAAAARDPRDAGLFHTAFLLPSRADLGRWLAHVIKSDIHLEGASDHIVSEAIYLSDPEGNGIEVYADRPMSRWRGGDGQIHMTTEPLDIPDLLAASPGTWDGFPKGGIIGHVHLQVGDTAQADGFYHGILGFDIASRYPGASFFGSGGYHHHLAGNIWNSRRAGARAAGAAGLESVEIILRDGTAEAGILERAAQAGAVVDTRGGASVLHDPWGTAIILRAA
ncbi:MAG: VOC family protein [Paracoccaceae bacterium]